MIERLPVERQNIGVPALVIDMAMIAVLNARKSISPVKANMVRAILRNLLVTIQAEPGLRSAREGLVAFFAFLLQLLVAFYQRPGDDEALDKIVGMRETGAT